MEITRRAFARTAGLSGATLLLARRSALAAPWAEDTPAPLPPVRLLLHNNENPLGPGRAVVEAVRDAVGGGGPLGRYPFELASGLRDAIGERYKAKPENIVLGCGSTQLLYATVQTCTSAERHLVSGSPSYGACTSYAAKIGTPVREVPVDAQLRLDLDAMVDASKGAGLVFFNNPNNPTATVWDGDAVDRFLDGVAKTAPDAVVLVDEAYHDYVADPAHRSQIPRALDDPRVLVLRTFSKAHGMAGMRVGYGIGHPETVKRVKAWEGDRFLNVTGYVAAMTSIRDQARLDAEAERNAEARAFTLDWFAERGYEATPSQCNFIFVKIGRPAKGFRDACRREGVLVGRDFPPLEKTWARISIGTLAQMQDAVGVFERALAAPA